MGVHGLWDLLAPVGRRVSVETLAGKRLAIDASIWMIQFMKAMRDENGEMVRNAHILGFFRRICKLLYLRTKPVFVFDGGTPALKRRTVIARRRQRENAQAKIRKTAEKLLLNQFKQIQLNKLAEELEKQKTNKKAKGKKVITGIEVEKLSKPSDFNDKEVITVEAVTTPKISEGNLSYSGCYNQEELDEMLAASLLTEEEGFVAGESSSGVYVHDQEEDADDDEEMILPAMHAKVDPAILAALPPSMQLDLLVQMRERLMAENRSKYQKVKKVPSSFSELQIESYLKTVAFRREIDEVRKSAAGRGIGGVQTSRIASEANREFIFSSSYSGDKDALTSAGRGSGNNDHISAPVAKSSNDIVDDGTLEKGKTASVSTKVDSQLEALRKGKTALVSNEVEPPLEYENDVETYLDERGRVRLSRVRAMGIRMTRDLQRNLDLMKEIEEETVSTSNIVQTDPSVDPNAVDASGKASKDSQLVEDSVLDTDEFASEDIKLEEALLAAGTSLEISFENNGQDELGVDDNDNDLFASLVAGDPVMGFSVDNSSSQKQDFDNASELEWEEGNTLSNDTEVVSRPCSTDGGLMDEKELEWEEGSLDLIQRDSSYMADFKENVSKGSIEEEADFQEAIRRSLQDVKVQKSENASCAGMQCRSIAQRESENTNAQFLRQEDLTNLEDHLRVESKDVESPFQVQGTAQRLDTMSKEGISHAHNPLEIHSAPPLGRSFGETEFVSEEVFHSSPKLDYSVQGKSALGSSDVETPMLSVASVNEKSVHKNKGWLMDTSGCKDDSFASSSNAPLNSDFVPEGWTDDLTLPNSDAAVDGLDGTAVMATASVANATSEIDFGKEPASGGFSIHSSTEREQPFGNFDYLGGKEEQRKVLNERVEEEMLMLGKEQLDLGNEQKKLERNAESVSSEMFAEAQELLQMFGLPYIIAPMEAEAQCAYLELIGLVDGVVTDDSDAFLFGACSVYKNIFDNRKYVETYFMKDIENELGINREKLIRMALLLGSDYTEGISGIGIVNAIEVVNAFPEEDGLRKFREWIESPDPSILGKFEKQAGGEPRKRGSKVGDDDKQVGDSSSAGNIDGSSDESQRVKQTFMDKHRNVSKNWHFSSSFPSDAVISAYASPQVDKAKEPFSWGKPDLLVLRKLCWEKFGWSAQKANELLLPVLKEYDKRETQLRMEAFYTFNERFAKIRSKRIKTALKGIAGTKSLPLVNESVEDDGGSKKGKRGKQCNAGLDGSIEASKRQKVQAAQLDASDNTETSNGNKSKRRRSSAGVGRSQNRSSGQEIGGRAKGRGRGRGRGTKESDSSDEAGFSSGDGSGAKSGQELQGGSEEQHQVRRSKRARKEVKYSMDEPKDVSSSDHATDHSGDEHAVKKDELADSLHTQDLDTVLSQTNNPEIESSPVSPEKDSNLCIDAPASEGTEEFQFGSPRKTEDGFPSDIHPSSDYLTMGGGFCLDDDDDAEVVVKDPIAEEASSPDMETTFDPSHGVCSSFVEDEEFDNATVHQDQSNADDMKKIAGVGISDDTKRSSEKTRNEECELANAQVVEKRACVDDSSVDNSGRSLRALPSLRRKRR